MTYKKYSMQTENPYTDPEQPAIPEPPPNPLDPFPGKTPVNPPIPDPEPFPTPPEPIPELPPDVEF